MVSNAPGYARTRQNRRLYKREFTVETTRAQKRQIIKGGQRAKRAAR
jgi:guanyl-specific ribonuclease Sa